MPNIWNAAFSLKRDTFRMQADTGNFSTFLRLLEDLLDVSGVSNHHDPCSGVLAAEGDRIRLLYLQGQHGGKLWLRAQKNKPTVFC